MVIKSVSFSIDFPEPQQYKSFQQELYNGAGKLHFNEFLVLSRDNLFDIFAVESDLNEVNKKIGQILTDYPTNKLKEFEQRNAVAYFFELALGKFEKTVAGYNILTQIKENFNIAMDKNATGPVLTKMYRSGIRFGEIVRQHPEINNNGVSTAEVILDIAKKINENLSDFRIIIFGQSRQKIESLLHNFKDVSNENILLYSKNSNATYNNAMELGCLPLESDQFDRFLTGNTLIVNTENNFGKQIKEIISIARNNRKSLYLYFNVSEDQSSVDYKKTDNLFVQTGDQINNIKALNFKKRLDYLNRLDQEIFKEVDSFYAWLYSDKRFSFNNMISCDNNMQKIFEWIQRVAPTDISVLINGETGTGKELVARAIHEHSRRNAGAFIAVNCSAIPETLLEAELFGYEKGAFTGAITSKKGLVELASGGTLFLDEIGDIPVFIQVKLLRVLQEREIMRIGQVKPVKVDVRLIAATNQELDQLINKGKFRSDLYYRINAVKLNLPPLSRRPDDILLLARYFVDKYNAKHFKKIRGLSGDVKDVLINYNWPGNVRELENIIERAVAISVGNYITLTDLPSQLRNRKLVDNSNSRDEEENKSSSLKELEAAHIRELLEQENMNFEKISKLLGIGRTTLWRKMKEYGISKNIEK